MCPEGDYIQGERPGREMNQGNRDQGTLSGENAVLYKAVMEGLNDKGACKWRNEESKGGGVIIWKKSFVVQRGSQGEGHEARVFLTCLQKSKKFC